MQEREEELKAALKEALLCRHTAEAQVALVTESLKESQEVSSPLCSCVHEYGVSCSVWCVV